MNISISRKAFGSIWLTQVALSETVIDIINSPFIYLGQALFVKLPETERIDSSLSNKSVCKSTGFNSLFSTH